MTRAMKPKPVVAVTQFDLLSRQIADLTRTVNALVTVITEMMAAVEEEAAQAGDTSPTPLRVVRAIKALAEARS